MRRHRSVAGLAATGLVLAAALLLPASAWSQQDIRGTADAPITSAPPPPPPPPPAPSPSASPSSGGSSRGFDSFGGDSGRAVRRGGDRVDRIALPGQATGDSSGHQRGNAPKSGDAIPRGPVPQSGGGVAITPAYGGFYPWGFAYGGAIGAYYGGYFGAYDPWYGWFPTYGPTYASSSFGYDGALRLKVKPTNASVYVDGYYVGVVDDFDGIFQRLHLEAGAHRIEIRAPEYEALTFDARITPDETTTYRGSLARLP